jgi:hypothetical protein
MRHSVVVYVTVKGCTREGRLGVLQRRTNPLTGPIRADTVPTRAAQANAAKPVELYRQQWRVLVVRKDTWQV